MIEASFQAAMAEAELAIRDQVIVIPFALIPFYYLRGAYAAWEADPENDLLRWRFLKARLEWRKADRKDRQYDRSSD